MEIRISITDAGAAGSSEKTIQVSGDSGASVGGSAGGAATAATPQENSAQASQGGIDAGPAPVMGAFFQAGVPQAFVAQRAANLVPNSSVAGTSTDESGGAAPGSGSGMEASTGEVNHG